jgi:hypothetical protein
MHGMTNPGKFDNDYAADGDFDPHTRFPLSPWRVVPTAAVSLQRQSAG